MNYNSHLLFKPEGQDDQGKVIWHPVPVGTYSAREVYTRHGEPPHCGYRPISQLITGIGLPNDSRMRYWVKRRLHKLAEAGYTFT